FFFSSRRRHTRSYGDWSSDVCSSDLDVFVCPGDHTPLQADATIADVPIDPLIGRTFEGKYRLDERLGGGGMGTVYRATHLLIDRSEERRVGKECRCGGSPEQ